MDTRKQDIEQFRQLRQQLQPLLTRDKAQLLQRIQGYVGVDFTSAPLPKLTKKQRHQQLVNKFL